MFNQSQVNCGIVVVERERVSNHHLAGDGRQLSLVRDVHADRYMNAQENALACVAAISRDGLSGSRVSSLGCGHRRVSRTAVGATGVLLPDWGALATVGPEGTDFEEDGEEGEDEGQEDEGFIGLLLGAG